MSTTNVGIRKYMKHRPNDYLYDPVYTVSSRRDFEKTAVKNIITCMEARVRPHFLSMFSELIQFPNADLALIKGSDHIPCFMEQKWDESKKPSIKYKTNEIDIRGKSMMLFLARPAPLTKSFPESYQHVSMPVTSKSKRALRAADNILTINKEESAHTIKMELPNLKIKATQTIYRESSAQTSPWQPPYKIMQINEDGHLPELLTLGALSWGVGLPAGVYECKMIERARMRRAWERSLIPVKDKEGLDKLVDALEKIERSEWAFREKELNRISRVRMDLMIQALENTCTKLSKRSMIKIKNYWSLKQAEKNKKLCQLKLKSTRELRKLEMKHKKYSTKYKSRTIVDEYLSYSSELYAPLDRHGDDPKQSHFCCCSDEFIPEFKNVDKLDVIPSWLNNYDKHDPEMLWRKKDKQRKICVRTTKWTIENLGKLQKMMTDARLRPTKRRLDPSKLLHYNEPKTTPPPTPTTESIPDNDEAVYQATLFLQKVIHGRAIQSIIYEGRDRNHELIEEIKTTHALLDADMNMKNLERANILIQQRARKIQSRSIQKIDEVIQTLEGDTVGSMLDYLNKELLRLQDERRAHAFALLALRERWKREAAEGGRRQKEERRRREHDEMFKQIVKIHQETVDLYLEDIIMKGLDNRAEEDAKAYIKEVADMIDKAVDCAVNDSDYLQQEEIAADLIHNFVIPEVEKQMVRENLRKKQEKYLLAAHETIYSEINTVAIEKQEQTEHERQQQLKHQQELLQEQHVSDIIALEEDVVNNIIKSFDEALKQAEQRYEEVENDSYYDSLEYDSEDQESEENSIQEDENGDDNASF